MQSLVTLQRTAERVQPLVDVLTRDLDERKAIDVEWEIKTVALNLNRGPKCGQGVTSLCGKCEWIGEETGLQGGVCAWIMQNEQPSLRNVLVSQPSQRIYFSDGAA